MNVHSGLPAEYARDFEREVTLKDGARVRIRPVLPEDESRLVTLYGRLSRHTAYQRFFTIMKRLPPDWAHSFANVDYQGRMALVAERDLDWRPELIGVARYEPSDEGDAEVAIVVQDYWQGKGLGTVLLEEILRAGEANGIRRFRAYVLADNRRMLAMLSRLTDVQQRKIEQGVVEMLFARRGTSSPTSQPDDHPLTTLPQLFLQMRANALAIICAFAQTNRRILGELIGLSWLAATESLRAYAEVQAALLAGRRSGEGGT